MSGPYSNFSPTGDIPYLFWEGIAVVVNVKEKDDAGKKVSPSDNLEDLDWGYRVKVRVIGEHTQDKTQLPDADLPWAEVKMSTLMGSGTATPQVRSGDIVGGYIGSGGSYNITWVKGKPGKAQLPFSQGPFGFDAFTERLEPVPSFSEFEGKFIADAWNPVLLSKADTFRGLAETFELPCPSEIVSGAGVMTEMDKLIQKVENAKKSVNDFNNGLQEDISRIQEDILEDIQKASEVIAGKIDSAIKWLQEQIMQRINQIAQAAGVAIPLNSRFAIREGMNIFVEAIFCFFNKLLDNLQTMVADFLNEAIDYFINTPLCAVEELLTGILGSIVASLNSIVNQLAGAISGLAGSVTSLITGVLDSVVDLLQIFQCEPDPECPETKEWNILQGAGENAFGGIELDFNSIIEKAISVQTQFDGLMNIIYDDEGNILGFDFDNFVFDITNQLNNPTCNGAPVFCGPPKVTFWGGGGFGASGNAIVNGIGQVIGVDIVSPGVGYITAPKIHIADDCGNGTGAIGEVIIGPIGEDPDPIVPDDPYILPPEDPEDPEDPGDPDDPEDDDTPEKCPPPRFIERVTKRKKQPDYSKYGVLNVIMIEKGTNYKTTFDGSLGGRGRTWAEKDQTYVQKADGRYLLPYNPGETFNLEKCDIVVPPDRRPIEIDDDEEYTAPPKSDQEIPQVVVNSAGSYPVTLHLCDLRILNAGISYQPTDKVKVSPDNGAIIEPSFNRVGALVSLNIVDHGTEVNDTLEITIESETGFNARIVPLICTSKPKDDKLSGGEPIAVIDVIDCVGKV